jgi:hypothetical protein
MTVAAAHDATGDIELEEVQIGLVTLNLHLQAPDRGPAVLDLCPAALYLCPTALARAAMKP